MFLLNIASLIVLAIYLATVVARERQNQKFLLNFDVFQVAISVKIVIFLNTVKLQLSDGIVSGGPMVCTGLENSLVVLELYNFFGN